jgi:hypothetical protein
MASDSVKNSLYLQPLSGTVEAQPSEFYGSRSQLVATHAVDRGVGHLRPNIAFFDFKFSLPLLLLLFLAAFFSLFRKKFSTLILSFLNFKKFLSYRRKQKKWGDFLFLLMQFLFSILSLALFFAEVAHTFIPVFSETKSFAFLFLAACTVSIFFLLLRFSICWLIGVIAEEKRLFSDIIHFQLMFFVLMGFTIIPMILIKNFYDATVSMYIFTPLSFLLLVIFSLYFFRTIRLFMQGNISIFFWILYFCTIEILPVTIAIKIIEEVQ